MFFFENFICYALKLQFIHITDIYRLCKYRRVCFLIYQNICATTYRTYNYVVYSNLNVQKQCKIYGILLRKFIKTYLNNKKLSKFTIIFIKKKKLVLSYIQIGNKNKRTLQINICIIYITFILFLLFCVVLFFSHIHIFI